MEWKFKIGEKVKSVLHGNSPTMTIRRCEEFSLTIPHMTVKPVRYWLFFKTLKYHTEYKTYYGKEGYICSWFDDNKNYHEQIFRENELIGVNNESSNP